MLSNSQFSDESSSSEEEDSSEECQSNSGEEDNLQTSGSESHKSSSQGSPRSLKRGTCMMQQLLKIRVGNQEPAGLNPASSNP